MLLVAYIYAWALLLYRASLLQDLIPELILSQKRHTQGSNWHVSGVMSFQYTVNKLERKEEHCAFIELCC